MNLKNLVNYNPETGIFTRKDKKNKIIGSYDQDGYLRAVIKYKEYKLHRLAWYLTHGEWPKHQIDHINRIKDDNRLCNLRESKNFENMANRVLTNNKYKFVGVNFDKRNNKFMARIMTFDPKLGLRKRKHLGYYETAQEASEVYDLWAQMTQGEFYHGR